MDVFSAALEETEDIDTSECISDSQARSQDQVHSQVTSPVSTSEVFVIDEDDLVLASTSASDDSPAQDKRPSDDSATSTTAKKRRRTVEPSFVLTEVVVNQLSSSITCVMVPRLKGGNTKGGETPGDPVPIPLFKQYTVTADGLADDETAWLVLSNYQCWFADLVNQVTTKSVRDWSKRYMEKFKEIFAEHVEKARWGNVLENPFDDSVAKNPKRFRAKNSDLKLELNIGGYSVTCLNWISKIVFKIDDNLANFIVGYIVPGVDDLVRKGVDQVRVSPDTSADGSQETERGFSFAKHSCPNIRDKVVWSPRCHRWGLQLVLPKGDVKEDDFTVDHKLPGAEYEAAKLAAYYRAIAAWNELDGSKRYRIVPTHA